MIKGIVIVNNHGKPRLIKFYQGVVCLYLLLLPLTLISLSFTQNGEEQQQIVIRKIFQQVSKRSESFCNYLEGCVPEFGETTKIIYRHYATLYFIFLVDQQESDLGILDLIQVFVEALDHCFQSVCELDLIFHSDRSIVLPSDSSTHHLPSSRSGRVHYIIDEIIMGGMVLETNLSSIITAITEQNKLQSGGSTSSVASSNNSSLGITTASIAAGKILSSFSSISG